MKKLNFSSSELIEIYNTISRVLDNKVTKVNLESSYASSTEKLLVEAKNGNYWIIKTEDGKEWLLPSNKLTVNQFNRDSIQSFFEFQSYDNSENKDFILVQPATVTLLPNASKKEWKPETLGILNFDPNYSINQLRSQLKKTENERDQYKSELEKIKQEKEQLTSQFAKLASDFLQDIRDSLVTKYELNKQIKIISQRIDKQNNLYDDKTSQTESKISHIIRYLEEFETELSLNKQQGEKLNQIPELLTRIEKMENYIKAKQEASYSKKVDDLYVSGSKTTARKST